MVGLWWSWLADLNVNKEIEVLVVVLKGVGSGGCCTLWLSVNYGGRGELSCGFYGEVSSFSLLVCGVDICILLSYEDEMVLKRKKR